MCPTCHQRPCRGFSPGEHSPSPEAGELAELVQTGKRQEGREGGGVEDPTLVLWPSLLFSQITPASHSFIPASELCPSGITTWLDLSHLGQSGRLLVTHTGPALQQQSHWDPCSTPTRGPVPTLQPQAAPGKHREQEMCGYETSGCLFPLAQALGEMPLCGWASVAAWRGQVGPPAWELGPGR